MIESLKAILVGIIQGLTEFLPVSSSGHIVIAQEILGLDYGEQENLLFAIVLHFATALSTIVIFRKDIVDVFKGLFKFKWNTETKFACMILISMIPAALVGVLLKDVLEGLFSNLIVVGISLLITSALLFFADRSKNTAADVNFKNAFIIGISQAFAALLPGLSRSGTTISTSILLGVDKAKAARFSFLMVLPLILGATLKMCMDLGSEGKTVQFSNIQITPMLLGFIAAFISGLLACKWMISFVKKAKLTYFSIYCLIVGISVIIYQFL